MANSSTDSIEFVAIVNFLAYVIHSVQQALDGGFKTL